MKTKVFSFTAPIIALTVLIFIIFQFIRGNFEQLLAVDFRIIFAGLVYIAAGVITLARSKAPFLGLFALAAGGFLLYMYFNYFARGTFSIENANFYIIGCAIAAGTSLTYGIQMYERNKDNDRLIANFSLSMAAILLLITTSNYYLPKPMIRTGFIDWLGFMVFAAITIAGSGTASALWKNKTIPSYCIAMFYRSVSVLGFLFCVIWLNNVMYSGCYPHSPIGSPCTIVRTKPIEPSLPIPAPAVQNIDPVKIPTSHDLSTAVIIPYGGSLCRNLHMTVPQAVRFAKQYHYKKLHHNGKLIIVIQPGQKFQQYNGIWKPVQ